MTHFAPVNRDETYAYDIAERDYSPLSVRVDRKAGAVLKVTTATNSAHMSPEPNWADIGRLTGRIVRRTRGWLSSRSVYDLVIRRSSTS